MRGDIDMTGRNFSYFRSFMVMTMLSATLLGCADASVPGGRNLNIPTPNQAEQRKEAVNERPDSVMYLPLGRDVLVPEMSTDDPLPNEHVGPFELRSETLAGALQLILADYEVPLAFETEEGLTRRITVANLSGPIGSVVQNVCGLADLYCSYENGLLVVKDRQTFTVKIPPISQDAAFMQNVATGLQAVLGEGATVTVDPSTRTLVYRASQRSSEVAERYFQRMRSSTALIVFETYIWEVSLDSGNSAGIRWNLLDTFGKFGANIDLSGSVGADFTNPISIGLPTTQGADGGVFSPTKILDFLSTFGAVKTISQPQITVLSGSQAKLRAADTQNYVAEVSETIDDGLSRTSVNTASIDTGFTLTIASAWDNATVYADVEIVLTDVSEIEDFDFQSGDGGSTTVQLPKSTERELTTQIRVRPGDSVLIAGLVRESDAYDKQGIGFMKPFIPTSRTVTTRNLELVFLLRPRVIVYTSPTEGDHHNAIRAYERRDQSVSLSHDDVTPVSAAIPYEGQNIPAPVAVTPLPPPFSGTASGGDAVGNPVPLGSVSPDLMDPSGG